MLKKRIIPTLLLSKGRMVKGQQFGEFRDTGDPVSAAKIYNAQNADELVFLDIDTHRDGGNFETLVSTIEQVGHECFMPLAVGGGIQSTEQIRQLLLVGADKVVITTAGAMQPELINESAKQFGKQCVIVGLDIRKENDDYVLYSHSGSKKIATPLVDYVQDMTRRGAGEFYVNSIDNDGMMSGYDLALGSLLKSITDRPVIIAGGAGNFMHLVDAFKLAKVDAVSCASLFHFGDNNPIRARSYLLNNDILMKKIK